MPGGGGAGSGGMVQNFFLNLTQFFDIQFKNTSNLIFLGFKVPSESFFQKNFKTGFTFPVALIQNEEIKVEHVSILMGHPVQYGNNGCGVFKEGIQK